MAVDREVESLYLLPAKPDLRRAPVKALVLRANLNGFRDLSVLFQLKGVGSSTILQSCK